MTITLTPAERALLISALVAYRSDIIGREHGAAIAAMILRLTKPLVP